MLSYTLLCLTERDPILTLFSLYIEHCVHTTHTCGQHILCCLCVRSCTYTHTYSLQWSWVTASAHVTLSLHLPNRATHRSVRHSVTTIPTTLIKQQIQALHTHTHTLLISSQQHRSVLYVEFISIDGKFNAASFCSRPSQFSLIPFESHQFTFVSLSAFKKWVANCIFVMVTSTAVCVWSDRGSPHLLRSVLTT